MVGIRAALLPAGVCALALLVPRAASAGALAPPVAEVATPGLADTAPTPTDPPPADPAPVAAQTTDPAPTDPSSTTGQPTDPAPTTAQPTDTAPTTAQSTSPAPTTTQPTDPAPTTAQPTAAQTTGPAPTNAPPDNSLPTDARSAKSSTTPTPAHSSAPLAAALLPTTLFPTDAIVTSDLWHAPDGTVHRLPMRRYSIVVAESPAQENLSGSILYPLALATPWSLFTPAQRTVAPWLLLLVLVLVLRVTVGLWARDIRRRRSISSS